MSTPSDTDYNFVLCCLKHSKEKPDFHAVAKELGLKTHMTAYHRHWNIMKKAGMAGNTGKGRKPGTGARNGAGGGGQKGGRLARSTLKTRDEESEEDDEEEVKAKPEPEDESEDEAESPAKKAKVSSGEDPGGAREEFA